MLVLGRVLRVLPHQQQQEYRTQLLAPVHSVLGSVLARARSNCVIPVVMPPGTSTGRFGSAVRGGDAAAVTASLKLSLSPARAPPRFRFNFVHPIQQRGGSCHPYHPVS